MDAVAPEYVAARRVLLDALEAMTDHLPSLGQGQARLR